MRYKQQNNKKLTLNSQLQTYQILTNNDQMLILCLSYFITTVQKLFLEFWQVMKLLCDVAAPTSYKQLFSLKFNEI